ncbi:TRAP transporter substrate-binding protein DctP [Ramlibacter alkalitolerans]|uniref:TRAP transporter substrate-binding protein DctP n=1 Tax=Ramlibacter alkalitolerans TaxID=2039631 RepID=A0ABS1JK18_9BURK|nr:TRAP transporter substrate-binding protein DctP [Ramlibacter alkalitolerans]MBL0424554.1 TRAP transporter substrate-binding protein DctP [Ramlibacter alkalitolerans]
MDKRHFIAAGLLAGACALAPAAFAQESIKLKVASNYPATSLFSRVQKHMLDEVTASTNGRVTFEWYYGGVLLKAADVFPGVGRGAADIAFTVPAAFNPREYPITGVTLPFLTENVQAASLAFRDWYNTTPAVQKEYQRNNVRFLLAVPASENVLWSQKKVNTAADLKGMRIRMLAGPGDALSLLGATAVTVPYTDAIDLLSRGGVEAISATPFEQGVKDGLPEMVNYLSSAGRMGIYAAVITAMNLDRWNSLPKDVQAAFLKAADNAIQYYAEAQGKDADESVDILLKAKRVQVLKMDPQEEKAWRDKTRDAILKKYHDQVARTGADGNQLVASYTALVRKYEQSHPYQTGIDRYFARKK